MKRLLKSFRAAIAVLAVCVITVNVSSAEQKVLKPEAQYGEIASTLARSVPHMPILKSSRSETGM